MYYISMSSHDFLAEENVTATTVRYIQDILTDESRLSLGVNL